MFFLALLSLSLFVVPVFFTFGIYFAADYQKILGCGFNCGMPGGGGFLGVPTDIVGHTFCQLSYAVTPDPGNYIFNPNQWNNKDDGSLCMKFTSDNAPDGYAAGWQAEWSFLTPGAETLPVHAFPNALVQSDSMPAQLSSINQLPFDVSWGYQTTAADLNANVCVDMFIASDESKSDSTTDSDYEVMVWLGQFGDSAKPLGFDLGALDTRVVSGTTFSLYSEANQFGQLTFTWLAAATTTQFKGDISPLLDLGAYKGPATTDYLGYLAFGSEVFYASANATFSVPKLELEIKTS